MTLSDALLKAGLVSREQHARETQRKDAQGQQRLPSQGSLLGKDVEELDHLKTVSEFRVAARKLLLNDPSLMTTVLHKAQRLHDLEGGRKLLAQLYSLRDSLEQLPEKEHYDCVARVLRRHGAQFLSHSDIDRHELGKKRGKRRPRIDAD